MEIRGASQIFDCVCIVDYTKNDKFVKYDWMFNLLNIFGMLVGYRYFMVKYSYRHF